MTKNYFYKEKLVGQDCYFCKKRVRLKEEHETLNGPICYVAHKECVKK